MNRVCKIRRNQLASDVFSGGRTETTNFTAYINPYMVVSRGGSYTKHIYIGSQRIVSKLGDLDSYGSDPRRIDYAGANVDGASVDYKAKYAASQQQIKDNYADFKVPYYGTDNNDYVNGIGFCCNDSPLQSSAFRAGMANDNPELFQYYYHSDHLGSTSLITDLDGNVVQHVEYVPFGEVFIEERNNTWNTPFLFNAKELDEETGLYYYGARYYDPRVSNWISADPLQEKYPNVSTYIYCANNPINNVDLRGDSVTVLNLGGAVGHSAMLIQNDEGKWQYYSFNGDWVYKSTDGVAGGKPYHDNGEQTFNSPQEFLWSDYNSKGSKEQVNNNTVDNYGFSEAYILPTTPEQDNSIRETFTDIENNESYSMGIKSPSNQCANVVQKSLNAAGIKTTITVTTGDVRWGEDMRSTRTFQPYFPNDAFKAIISNNPNGTYLKKK